MYDAPKGPYSTALLHEILPINHPNDFYVYPIGTSDNVTAIMSIISASQTRLETDHSADVSATIATMIFALPPLPYLIRLTSYNLIQLTYSNLIWLTFYYWIQLNYNNSIRDSNHSVTQHNVIFDLSHSI